MSFTHEKRYLVAGLAALAPMPLPFNDVVGLLSLLLFLLGIGLFAWRTSENKVEPIPNWSMNVLGTVYLPIFLVEFGFFWQGRLLRPLVHLALFTLVVKLFGMHRERDKWHIFLLIFFLFVASMGSSVHPSILLFLVAFLSLSILVLAKFASFHVLGNYGAASERPRPLALRGFVITCTILTLIGAVPLFVLLPRLGRPYVVGPGAGGGEGQGGSGLTDTITLDVVGRVRTSREVTMRVSYETPPPEGHDMRFRAGVYSEFLGSGWGRGAAPSERMKRSRDGFFHIGEGQSRSWASIWLEPLASSTLVVPIEAVALDLRSSALQVDSAGVLSPLFGLGGTLKYRVGMAPASRLLVFGTETRPEVREADLRGVSAPITELAEEVAGSGSAQLKARRIEAYLASEYAYTLDLVGSQVDNPVEAFLFDWRQGHCEYFASSMVLMLRSIGIPARLVTGFLGGEYNPFEGYYVFRQSDSHAWVEAFTPEVGWQVFDPTPADGLPQARSAGLNHMLAQAYDYLIFRWDRYVLTYGFFDQVGMARKFLVFFKGWLQSIRSDDTEPSLNNKQAQEEAEVPEEGDEIAGDLDFELTGYELIPFVLVILLSAWWIWRHRPGFSAVRAYRRLRHGVERSDVIPITVSVAPLTLADEIERHRPAASRPARRVIDLYLRESFGGQPLDAEELIELRSEVREALQRLRKSA